MSHITFDYSKVLESFAGQHEIDFLQGQVTEADKLLREGTGPGQISWVGLIFQKTMIKMNLHVS